MTHKQPNIVFVITDDQGYGDLACLGNQVVKTPNIDALYGESAHLTDYHVGPTCAPTRAGLLTGHFHNSTGVWHTVGGRSLLREDEYSMASAFADAGYATGIFGKWHLGETYPYRPMDRGFGESVVHGGGGIGNTPDYWNNDYFDDCYFNKGVPQQYHGYCTDVFFGLAQDFITRKAGEGKPFFCFLPTNAPHIPWQIAPEYAAPYQGLCDGERANFYGMIANIDENFGKLRQTINDLGIAENTIVIFTTDNGTWGGCTVDGNGHVTEGHNAGMRGVKCWEYEGGHRTPFFIHWPAGGLQTGKDLGTLCANVDIMPTLLDLCGASIPTGLDGTSLKTLLTQNNDPTLAGRVLVTDSQRIPNPEKWRRSCVMQDVYRLINQYELYNIALDPAQTCDIARSNPAKVAELQGHYDAWWQKVSARFGEEIPLFFGADEQAVTILNTHDIRGDAGDAAWDQIQIRQGKIVDSYWEVSAVAEGEYQFELRRWPEEAGLALTDGIYDAEGIIGRWRGGRAIPVVSAHLAVGEQMLSKPLQGDEHAVSFCMHLPAGAAHLKAWFTDETGVNLSAYYVYVSRC